MRAATYARCTHTTRPTPAASEHGAAYTCCPPPTGVRSRTAAPTQACPHIPPHYTGHTCDMTSWSAKNTFHWLDGDTDSGWSAPVTSDGCSGSTACVLKKPQQVGHMTQSCARRGGSGLCCPTLPSVQPWCSRGALFIQVPAWRDGSYCVRKSQFKEQRIEKKAMARSHRIVAAACAAAVARTRLVVAMCGVVDDVAHLWSGRRQRWGGGVEDAAANGVADVADAAGAAAGACVKVCVRDAG
eukprot:352471-Chlamydomonas_euryale.AAC.1